MLLQPPIAVQACEKVPKYCFHIGHSSSSCPDSRISFLQLYFKSNIDKGELSPSFPFIFSFDCGCVSSIKNRAKLSAKA
ncbi:hypothetical protein MA16_Dca007538 [Dendrobium catenatum]|uniref:Uncharacterized protein n=1 Tax=Dendrobium catenatum TaxID=906689 RepID=A0A2I0WBD1_9ASPA|nr:hypothetical protein MA16_Dca007538 [Dendrobium catenatum]